MSVKNVSEGEWFVEGAEDNLDALEQVLNFVEDDEVDTVIKRGVVVSAEGGYTVSVAYS